MVEWAAGDLERCLAATMVSTISVWLVVTSSKGEPVLGVDQRCIRPISIILERNLVVHSSVSERIFNVWWWDGIEFMIDSH